MDARDTLTVVLLTARKQGIRIDESRFVPQASSVTLAYLIQDVREDLQAIEGQLARVEKQALREAGGVA